MDGFSGGLLNTRNAHYPRAFGRERAARRQTLATSISCQGIGLHSGRMVRLDINPAPPGSGIAFHRLDLAGAAPLTARYDAVLDTRLCTVIGDVDGTSVSTIEHLMAALGGLGIDDALITLDGPEVPILDGSAEPYRFLIDCAGIAAHGGESSLIEIVQPVRVEAGQAWAELLPPLEPGRAGLDLSLSIDFAASAIGRQSCDMHLTPNGFRAELASARTFTLVHEIQGLRDAGLALGGSLDNAIVVDDSEILNAGGLRMPDEFVRHKLLDVVGDLALAGAPLQGRFRGHRTGHALNNLLVRALFADTANWRSSAPAEPGWLSAA